ncbi:peptidase m20d family protein, partial [Paenibacillus sp. Aloe-11]
MTQHSTDRSWFMTQHSTDRSWFDQLQAHMVEWRRYLHKNPEISFQESNTAAFVADKLESWGIEVRRQVGGHGVVGTIRGAKPGPVVML